MKYSTGKIGRIILARFDHGEEILSSLKELCKREGIEAGWVFLFGALARGKIVLGPREEKLPPVPVIKEFDGPYEVLAAGSVAMDDGEISIHIHSSLGSKSDVLSGCIRDSGKIFIVIECLILEIEGTGLVRKLDPVTGLKLLDFS
jgi:predicted DNA-binding protein with PD1-like motif